MLRPAFKIKDYIEKHYGNVDFNFFDKNAFYIQDNRTQGSIVILVIPETHEFVDFRRARIGDVRLEGNSLCALDSDNSWEAKTRIFRMNDVKPPILHNETRKYLWKGKRPIIKLKG